MKNLNNKQRLFEVMSRVDKTFKHKLNEWGDENDADYDNNPRNFDSEQSSDNQNIKSRRMDDHPKWNKHEEPTTTQTNEGQNDDLLDFTVPDWAISALINGDNSGNSDEDDQKIEAFVRDTVAEYGNANFMLGDVDGKDNLGFCRSNDIDNLGSECHRLYLRPTK